MRKFALIFGIFYLLTAIAGMIPGFMTSPLAGDPSLTVNTMYGRLFGLFPMNIVHMVIHAAIGIWGILASRSWDASRGYARFNAILFLVLAVMGLFPTLHTTFGLAPLFSHDIWLHAVSAILAGYFGFVATRADRTIAA